MLSRSGIGACLPERPWPESPTCMSHQHFPVILFSLHAVRQIDRRDPGHPCTLVEVVSRDCGPIAPRAFGRLRRLLVDLNSIDSPLSRPHLFAVGGSDTWLRMYDRRMTASDGGVEVVSNDPPFIMLVWSKSVLQGTWTVPIVQESMDSEGCMMRAKRIVSMLLDRFRVKNKARACLHSYQVRQRHSPPLQDVLLTCAAQHLYYASGEACP